MSCTHQGPELGTIGCRTCQGNVRIKVFACARHGCCTIQQPLWPVEPGRYGVCNAVDRAAAATGAGCPDKSESNGRVNLVRRVYGALPDSWRRWIADAVLSGSDQIQVVRIIAQKFGYDVAVVELTAAQNHPYVAAGLAAVEKIKSAKAAEAETASVNSVQGSDDKHSGSHLS